MGIWCVREGATGATGLDWDNAFTTLAAALAICFRGDTIYVAAGHYSGGATANTIAVGSSLITIKKATVEDHGIPLGWVDSYASGQALFDAPIWFKSNYWVFDGVSRTDWRGTYGFKVRNNNGSTAVPLDNDACIRIGDATLVSGGNVSHVSLKYVEAEGAGDRTGTYSDNSLAITNTTGSPTDNLIQYCRIHKAGTVCLNARGTTGLIVEYCLIENNQSTGSHTTDHHGELIAVKEVTSNITIRFCRLVNAEGTGYFGSPSGGEGYTYTDWRIYGNTIYYNAATAQAHQGGAQLMQLFNYTQFAGVLVFAHNTIVRTDVPDDELDNGSGSAWPNINVVGDDCTVNLVIIKNNLFYGTTSAMTDSPPAGVTGTYNWDFNAFYDATHAGDASAHKITGSGDPFIDAENEDFRLTVDIGEGDDLSEYISNVDAAGRLRTNWTPGAFEYDGEGGGEEPVPATARQTRKAAALLCTAGGAFSF